jgi:hypothetical protein
LATRSGGFLGLYSNQFVKIFAGRHGSHWSNPAGRRGSENLSTVGFDNSRKTGGYHCEAGGGLNFYKLNMLINNNIIEKTFLFFKLILIWKEKTSQKDFSLHI